MWQNVWLKSVSSKSWALKNLRTHTTNVVSQKKESNLTSSLFKNIFNEISSKVLKAKIVSMQCDVSEYIATIVSNVESIVTSEKWRKCDRKWLFAI